MSKVKMKVGKKVLTIIVGVMLVWNIFWGINYYTYYKFVGAYTKDKICYIKGDGKYTYSVSCPTYFDFTGNFAVSNDNENNLFLIIWPNLFMLGSEKTGIMINDNEVVYSFYVDEKMNYTPSKDIPYTDEEEKYIDVLLEENRVKLNEMWSLANKEWNLRLSE